MTGCANDNATGQGGVQVAGGQAKATFKNIQQANHSAFIAQSTAADILASKSTATEVQLAKIMALLRTGPKTTIQLRDHGVMMPAARVHHLRHVDGHEIISELVTLYDDKGFRHSKCARYRLVVEATAKGAA